MNDVYSFLRKFWTGSATTVERLLFLRWLNSSMKDLRGQFDKLSLSEEEEQIVQDPERKSRILNRLHDSIDKKHPVIKRLHLLRIAASIIAIISFLAIWLLNNSDKTLSGTWQSIVRHEVGRWENEGTSDTTVYLPDGSTVRLAAKSTLSIQSAFNQADRIVHLIGKARFAVKKNREKPFSVHTDFYATTAVGTIFTVDARHPLRTEITLHEGRVFVESLGGAPFAFQERQYLSPGQRLVADGIAKQYTVQETGKTVGVPIAPPAIDHTGDMLVFHDAPLNEVFIILGELSHIEISPKGVDLGRYRFTGRFDKGTSLQYMLQSICKMNDLTFKMEKEKILIQTIQ